MESIIQYKAKDGRIFNNEENCLTYEQQLDKIEKIMSGLFDRPDSCDFINGGGYIQQEKNNVDKAIIDLVKASGVCDHIANSLEFNKNPFTYRNGIIGRYLDDNDSFICKHWLRFRCMDDNYREYGQPYFASNPSQAKQINLNIKEDSKQDDIKCDAVVKKHYSADMMNEDVVRLG